ncbi:MAG: acyl-CoA dehydrogenase [Chloroflexota bacterium]|nr:MAG: acyl-CoA dehydrogenase [Chloroflexota bacterium]
MYELTQEHIMLRNMVRDLAQNKVAPRAAEIDEKAEWPWDIADALASADLFGLPFPEQYGGTGTDLLSLVIVVEELAKVCASTALMIGGQGLGSFPIAIAGTEEQKQRWFPKLASGQHLAAFALTEPGAGSDPAHMSTRAVRDGDSYVLNGQKIFITHAGVAHIYTVFATVDPAKGSRGQACFVVEKGTPGFSVGKMESKMGIRASPTGELIFEDCRVPIENLLGKEGDAFKIAMQTLDKSRPAVAAQALGIAQGATDFAARYATERVQFGQPIAQFQGIQFMLADMETKTAAARELVYKAATLVQKGDREASKYSAMCKLFASDVAMEVTTNAVQILGGYGYTKEYPVERMMRDAKITQIYEGTNQIQRLVVARAMLSRFDRLS